jgi:hypothetical protein
MADSFLLLRRVENKEKVSEVDELQLFGMKLEFLGISAHLLKYWWNNSRGIISETLLINEALYILMCACVCALFT